MRKNRIALCMLLVFGTILCGCTKEPGDAKGQNSSNKTNSQEKKMEAGTWLKSKDLEEFNNTAIEEMLEVPAVGKDAYYTRLQSEDAFEEKQSLADIETEEPYQVRIKDADRYGDTLDKLIDLYIRSYKSVEEQGKYDPSAEYFQPTVDILSSTLLAGDRNDFVMQVNFRQYVSEEEISWYEKEHDDWGEVITTKDGTHLYGDWTLHARMVKDYVFELTGVVDSKTAITAFGEKYPGYQAFYDEIPVIKPTPLEKCRAKAEEGQLQVTYDNGESWKRVPVNEELLFARGDEREGRLTSLQAGSYYVSEDLTIFLYGGSTSVPLTAMVSTDGGENFCKTVISNSVDIRAEFVSIPKEGHTIYVLAAGGRTMSQEGNILYKSENAGKDFVKVPGIENTIHSLTTDFCFLTERNGFICIGSSESPYMLVTKDAGNTWEEAKFQNVPEYYSMAYAPEMADDGYELYIGEEGYAKEEGIKYRFISGDEGSTWIRDTDAN